MLPMCYRCYQGVIYVSRLLSHVTRVLLMLRGCDPCYQDGHSWGGRQSVAGGGVSIGVFLGGELSDGVHFMSVWEFCQALIGKEVSGVGRE